MSTKNVPPWYGVSDGPVAKKKKKKRENHRVLARVSITVQTTRNDDDDDDVLDLVTPHTKKNNKKDIIPIMRRTRDGPAHVRQRVADEFHRHARRPVGCDFAQFLRDAIRVHFIIVCV